DDQKLARAGEATPLKRAQPRLDLRRHAAALLHVPAQDRLGGDLVDVLSAGTAGARETPGEFFVGDTDTLVDFEHGKISVHAKSCISPAAPGSVSSPQHAFRILTRLVLP